MKNGDYIIQIGGKAGAVKKENRILSFECVHCVRHLLKNRIGINDNAIARKRMTEKPYYFSCQMTPKHN